MVEPTAQQLKNRELAASGGTPTGFGENFADTLLKAMQDKALGSSDMVSSAKTGFEEAIASAQKAGAASTARIESQFDREIGFQKEQFGQQRTGALESRRGFATNTAALRALDERTEKSLRDLEQRKQELILAGESETAGRIGELQIKSIEFRQQAEQQMFSNVLNMGNLAVNIQQEQRLSEQQTQQFAMNRIEFLNKSGALKDIDKTSKANLEKDALLPAGAIDSLAESPAGSEIRTVGNSIVSIDPRTNAIKILYTDTSTTGSVDFFGNSISLGAASIISGAQKFGDMTTSDASDAKASLSKLGFGQPNAPEWFKKFVATTNGNNLISRTLGVQMTLNPDTVDSTWGDYQMNLISGGRFIDKNFLRTVQSPTELANAAIDSGYSKESNPKKVKDSEIESYVNHLQMVIDTYRSPPINMTDAEILQMLKKK